MVILNRFGPAWGSFGCVSQFVLKIETYLRMANIEFQTKSLGLEFAETAPKGKLPYIDHDGHKIADSSFIIEYLKRNFGDPLDANLSLLDKAKGHAVQRMVEDHIWWLMAQERWWAPENPYWDTPGLLQGADQATYDEFQTENQRKCIEHGVGAFTPDELRARGKADIDAIAALLGDQTFLLGEQPSSFDTTVYAFLWQILNAPYASALKDSASSQTNLVDYTKRIEHQFFANDPMSLARQIPNT